MKRLVNSKRCIVPAKGYYEWQKLADGTKQPFYITPKTESVFSFAGLWDEWHSPNGEVISTFTIITTTPNKEMAEIHNRMPAILSTEQMEAWLSPLELSQSQADDILRPLPDDSLEIVRVSKDVNSPRNNRENLIYPLED